MPYLGHQLNETVRLFNLWKQVQKPSKFVDFTKVGAGLKDLSMPLPFLAKNPRKQRDFQCLREGGSARILHTTARLLTGKEVSRIQKTDNWVNKSMLSSDSFTEWAARWRQ
jgi:hypothetical protein